MRVLEPHHLQRSRQPRKSPAAGRRWRWLALVVVLGASYLLFGQGLDKTGQSEADKQQVAATAGAPKVLRQFTAEEFKAAYSTYAYPNTELVVTPPEITGNDEADTRIRKIAEARGYKLTAVPVASIVKAEEPGLEDALIQPNALVAWQKLKASAAEVGITLKLTSAYRSIDDQRTLFLRRMQAAGVNIARVLEGYADDELDAVLSRAAIPGYSRHHTGYTIDLSCNGVGLESFIATNCYQWLSDNNFAHVKEFGWVPSYPEGVGGTGPEPESWEYVWVGTGSTYE